MLVVLRFRLAHGESAEDFRSGAASALAAFAARPGFRSGRVGRALEDVTAWVLVTEWEHVGAFRRALSAYEVKLMVPFLSRAIDEPTAYEVVEGVGDGLPDLPSNS